MSMTLRVRRQLGRPGRLVNQGLALLGGWAQLFGLLILLGYFLLRGRA